jgi:cysteine desulfurase
MLRIYFDHNSTSILNKKVKEALLEIAHLPLNPSSTHSDGTYARKILEDSRMIIKEQLKVQDTHELIFTSSCTESNNLVLHNFSHLNKICSTIEHPSVINVIGDGVLIVDEDGVLNLEYLESYLKMQSTQCLVSVMYANNAVGTIQPTQEIKELAKKYGCLFHCDVTQAVGRIDLDVTNIDLITLSSHKFGGPVGAGVLLYKKLLSMKPMILGGGQEFSLRSGTQNLIAIHGMGRAFELLEEITASYSKVKRLRDYLEKALLNISDTAVIFGVNADRLPNTSSFSMPGVNAETQLIHFDINGISISAGSACSSGKLDISRTQLYMGFAEDIANNAIRISLGPENTMDEIERFIEVCKTLYTRTCSVAFVE